MREAPSRVIVAELARRGAVLQAYDPVAMPEARRVLAGTPGLHFAASPHEALEGADALLVVTEWKEFRTPDFDAIKAALKQPLIFDGRNIYDPALMRLQGIEYHGIGRARQTEAEQYGVRSCLLPRGAKARPDPVFRAGRPPPAAARWRPWGPPAVRSGPAAAARSMPMAGSSQRMLRSQSRA